MAKNMKYENALHISVEAPYNVESGGAVAVGLIRGVAIFAAQAGERVTVWLVGSWEFELEAAVNEGDAIFIVGGCNLATSGGDFFGVDLVATSGAGTALVATFG